MNDYIVTFSMVGPAGVGKSTLGNAYFAGKNKELKMFQTSAA